MTIAPKEKKRIEIIGCASDAGGLYNGARIAPEVLRRRGLVEKIERLGWIVTDAGDISSPPNTVNTPGVIRNESAVLDVARSLYRKTLQSLNSQALPLIIGGDHSLSMGSVAAFSDHCTANGDRPGVIWIDTHPDLNTPSSSPSGCAFGMPVAALLGYFDNPLAQIAAKLPAIMPSELVYIGLREVDPEEKRFILRDSITSFTMKKIDIHGLADVVSRSLDHLSRHCQKIMVSFDLDVCDPPLVPGTGTPKRGGISYRESHLLLELLCDSGQVAAAEIVELNPILDQSHETADLALSLIESLLGKSIL